VIENRQVHTWSISTSQEVLGSSALIFNVALASAMASDLSQFLVTTWARHPDLIPNEIGGIVPELVVPFIECTPPLFVSSLELVHSKCNTLKFLVFIRVLEVHDYTILEDSDDDPSEFSDDSVSDGLPRLQASLRSFLLSWPKINWVTDDLVLPSGEPWSTLPSHGGGVASTLSPLVEACPSHRDHHALRKWLNSVLQVRPGPMGARHDPWVMFGLGKTRQCTTHLPVWWTYEPMGN
jgi:hypothetical protein